MKQERCGVILCNKRNTGIWRLKDSPELLKSAIKYLTRIVMNLSDFISAMQSILLLRLKWNEWDAARLMRDNTSTIERHFHEGYAPIESINELTGVEYPEYFGAPDGSKVFGAV
jgi:hypothetical protein